MPIRQVLGAVSTLLVVLIALTHVFPLLRVLEHLVAPMYVFVLRFERTKLLRESLEVPESAAECILLGFFVG